MEPVNHIQLAIPPHHVKPILLAIIRTIFFQRTLETFEPETYEVYDTHVSTMPDDAVEKDIKARVEQFNREHVEIGHDAAELAVVFLQKKTKKHWWASTEELTPWEEHLITVSFIDNRHASPPSEVLQKAIMQTLAFCLENKQNVPAIPKPDNSDVLTYRIMLHPPPPSELFSPSPPPVHPARLTSPPPMPSLTTTPATAVARDLTLPPAGSVAATLQQDWRPAFAAASAAGSAGAGTNTGMGYLEQAKEVGRFVGQKAGAVTGWGGRGGFGKGTQG